MSLSQWVFSDPESHQTADGRHTFYRVKGECAKRELYGSMVSMDWTGMLVPDVIGEGATSDDALADAMRKAITEDERRQDAHWNAQVARMGGMNYRR